MTLWTVLPVKPFAEAKTRLADELSQAERMALAERLFDHSLTMALRFARRRPVLVVTRSEQIADRAARLGAVALLERGSEGLNAALKQAADYVLQQGGRRMLSVATDLPLLKVGDLDAITARARAGFAIAPDRHGNGTNALLQPVSNEPLFRFGPESFQIHTAAIRGRGITPVIISRIGLALDIDCEADIHQLGTRKSRFLRRIVGAESALLSQ